jgi:hypothetical protein
MPHLESVVRSQRWLHLTASPHETIMTGMRLRLAALAFCALILSVVTGGCKFAGVSGVYMTIDSGGAQPRQVFYTDSIAIYCDTKFSSAKQDATVDFYVNEVKGPDSPAPIHSLFATDEETPGPGTESVVSFQVPQSGIQIAVMCNGYCSQNGIGCMKGYADDGNDSCGIGATCCYNAFAQAASAPSVLPYPVGDFNCEVDVDGEIQGVTDFSILYPPKVMVNGVNEECPVSPPFPGAICAGWVEQGSVCTGFDDTTLCTCDGAAWTCKPKS